MTPEDALAARGGAAQRGQLLRDGVTRRGLQRASASGELLVVCRGVYALPSAPPALVSAARLHGVASHGSAAEVLKLEVLTPSARPCVSVPRSRSRIPSTTAHIKWSDVAPEDRHPRWPVTDIARTLLDCARTLPTEQAVVIADSAVRSRRIGTEELVARLTAARGPGSASARRVVELVDGRCESVLESLLRVLLVLAGYSVRSQVWIEGVGRVDFLVEGRLVVEADGFAYHSERAHYGTDRRRGNELLAQGLPVLRFSWEDVVHRPAAVLRTVARALACT